MKKLILNFIFIITLLSTLKSQTITTGTVPTPLCATGVPVTFTLTYTKTGIFTLGNTFTAQLSDAAGLFGSPIILGSFSSIGAGSIVCTIPGATPAGAGYKVRIVSSNPVAISNLQSMVINSPVGVPLTNPAVFGAGLWNVYVYKGINFDYYFGSYTENLLGFSSTTRWPYAGVPSSANGSTGIAYAGCITNANHSVVYKRADFPCDYYHIDIPDHDDNVYLFVNGGAIFSHIGCCDAHPNLWNGVLSNTSTVEYKWTNDLLSWSKGDCSVLPMVPTATFDPASTSACTSFLATWTWPGTLPPVGYNVDVATNSSFIPASILPGYNSLSVGTATSLTVSGLSPGNIYYLRVQAVTPCGLSAYYSNTVTIDFSQITATPASTTILASTPQTLIAGNASTYTWSPSTYLNISTGATVVSTPTSNITYTVTGTTVSGCITKAVANILMNTLPIELINFDVDCDGKNVILNWATATEKNNKYFKIMKTNDLENFVLLGTLNGAGSSSSYKYYSFKDTINDSPLKYYQLRQVDINGITKTVGLKASNCANESDPNIFFGNPTGHSNTQTINVFPSKDNFLQYLTIYNSLGQLVFKQSAEVNTLIDRNVIQVYLPPAVYVVSASFTHKTVVKKLLVN